MNSKKLIFIFLISLLFLSAALSYNTNKEIFAWGEKEKCVVDPIKENKFTEEEIEKGKIPIGETTDETELFAKKIINELESIYTQGTSIKNEALSMRDKAESEINEALYLINLTSPGSDNTKDCVNNCPDAPCVSACVKSTGGCCNPCECEEPPCGCCGYTKYCKCQTCGGTPCPLTDINNTYNQIKNHYNNLKIYYDTLKDRPQEISNSKNRAIGLIEAKNLLPNDPNRWKILNKLLDSRVKLEKCLTGYGFPVREGKIEMMTLSCEAALNKIYLDELVILGYFDDAINPFPYCYPYTADEVKPKCDRINENCNKARKSYMDNWFCCEGE